MAPRQKNHTADCANAIVPLSCVDGATRLRRARACIRVTLFLPKRVLNSNLPYFTPLKSTMRAFNSHPYPHLHLLIDCISSNESDSENA